MTHRPGLPTQEPWIAPIPGTSKLHRLQENPGALDVDFTGAQIKQLSDAAAAVRLTGERLPAPMPDQTGE